MGNEALEQANNINQEIGKQLLNHVCQDLADEHKVDDPEDFERLKNSVKLLSDWMSKGMEIYAAVQAPTEVKAVFPPVETQALAEKAIALHPKHPMPKNDSIYTRGLLSITSFMRLTDLSKALPIPSLTLIPLALLQK